MVLSCKFKYLFAGLLGISLFLSACGQGSYSESPSTSDTTSAVEHTTATEEAVVLPDEYNGIISSLIKAFPWNDDVEEMVPELPELSYLYRRHSSLDEIGYALVDVDQNGQEELLLADINSPGVYDVYTISGGEAVHLFDSGERYYHYLYEDGYVENQWSASALISGHNFYKINGGTLDFIETITYDAYRALDQGLIEDLSQAGDGCYFRAQSNQEADYQPISSHEASKAIETFQEEHKQLQVEYTVLSQWEPVEPLSP